MPDHSDKASAKLVSVFALGEGFALVTEVFLKSQVWPNSK